MSLIPESKLSGRTIEKIEKIVGAANVSIKETDRAAYSRDLWPLGQIWMMHLDIPHPPDAVVWVGNEEQISALLRLANEEKFPVIPFAAGSGVCGGTLPIAGGVVMDVKKMNRILATACPTCERTFHRADQKLAVSDVITLVAERLEE